MESWKKLNEVLKKKGFRPAQIRKIQQQFGKREVAEMLITPKGQLISPLTGRSKRKLQEKLNLLLESVREVSLVTDDPIVRFSGVQDRERNLKAILNKTGVSDMSGLRRLASDPEKLKDYDLDETVFSTVKEFSELARFFQAPIAFALQQGGVHNIHQLNDWNKDKFDHILESIRLDPIMLAAEWSRLERLSSSIARNIVPANGISLDLGDEKLYEGLSETFGKTGIETWVDWAIHRGKTGLTEEQTTALDARARLQTLGITGKAAGHLIKEGVLSSLDLARLGQGRLSSLAINSGLESDLLQSLSRDAVLQTNQVALMLDQMLSGNNEIESASGFFQGLPDLIPGNFCIECASEQSAFSRFAYYVYLVQKTSKLVDELQNKLMDDKLLEQILAVWNSNSTMVSSAHGGILKLLSPVNGSIEISDPLADCRKITILDLIIRLLQDYLEELQDNAADYTDHKGYIFLPYEAWRADRIAYYFPEIAALWRDDVLTGESDSASRGSIIKDRKFKRGQIFSELELATGELSNARISKGQHTLEQFMDNPALVDSSSATEPFSSTPYYKDFNRGIEAIRLVLNADDSVQEMSGHLDHDQTGLAMSAAHKALGYLDQLAGYTFMPASIWQVPEMIAIETLTSMPPAQRKQRLETLSSELMSGAKAIFAPDKGIIQASIDHNILGGQVTSLNPWEINTGFRLSLPKEPHYFGKIVLVANNAEGISGIPRQCRYRDGTALRDYTFSVTGNITSGRTFSGNIHMASDERVGVSVRSEDEFNRYQLVIKSKVVDVSGPTSLRHFLVLERVVSSHPTELASSEMISTETGLYKFTISTQTNSSGSSIISGTVERLSSGSVISVSFTDSQFTKGTFGLIASPTVSAGFGPLFVTVDSASQIGAPPFYAPRRKNLKDHLSSFSVYLNHKFENTTQSPKGMADDLLGTPITYRTGIVAGQELYGLATKRILLFREKATAVSLDGLDILLDKCLALSFYLRFAVLPTRLSQVNLQSGNFESAVRNLHLLYDNTAQAQDKEIYPFFTMSGFSNSSDRRLFHLRLGEAYSKWADWLYRQDSPKSRHQARRYYKRVLALHDKLGKCGCEMQVGTVIEGILDRWLKPVPPGKPGIMLDPDKVFGAIGDIFNDIGKIKDIETILDLIGGRDPGTIDPSPIEEITRFENVIKGLNEHVNRYTDKVNSNIRLNSLMERGDVLFRDAELTLLAREGTDPFRGQPSGNGMSSTIFFSGWSGATGWGIEGIEETVYEWAYGTFNYPAFCIPPDPLQVQQVRHACLMLELINNCRNFMGFTDKLIPALRFETLLSLARSFVDQAHATERDVLSFRQSFEQESYSLLQAHSNLVMSEGEVGLEMLNLELSQGDMRLAFLQQLQAVNAHAHYQDLITNGLSNMEKLALGAAWAATAFSGVAALGGILSAGATAIGSASTASGNPAGLILAGAGIAGTLLGGAQGLAGFSSSLSGAASMQASFERREQEWEFSKNQNHYNLHISNENLSQAARRYEVSGRRHQLAVIKRGLAEDGVQFLNNKFLNRAMWVWLQRQSREQYLTRLNYAITMAYMAERALAFELQNSDLKVIRFDYYDPKRDGLLGATQLQTDLTTLENMKISLTHRKRHLTKTFPLSRLMPLEFEQFRQTGQLAFSTSSGNWDNDNIEMSDSLILFDRDFPGHYMRLIKNVSVTIIALIPPHDGIRASLRNSGISRVVVGPPYSNEFREETVSRNPESIALSSPFQSSGLFNLDSRDDLLLPFEGLGVATDWIFELPRAANSFDYRTIADVLVTIDYTALESTVYRQHVIQKLPTTLSLDLPFSFRHKFADAWYDLNNPDLVQGPQKPMEVVFATGKDDFPPNLDNLTIEHVSLFMARKHGVTEEVELDLKFTRSVNTGSPGGPFGGPAVTSNGVASTRQDTFDTWDNIQGEPFGEWSLAFEDDPDDPAKQKMRNMLNAGQVDDILLVVTFNGKTAEWPA